MPMHVEYRASDDLPEDMPVEIIDDDTTALILLSKRLDLDSLCAALTPLVNAYIAQRWRHVSPKERRVG